MGTKIISLSAAILGAFAWLGPVEPIVAYAQDVVWPTRGWQTSAPEAEGMDSAALAKLVADGASHYLDSLLIERHGRIVAEAYYAPYAADIPHNMFSATKSVTGTLLAMTYKDGRLDRLDRPVLDFFADRRIANVDERKRAITVQNLLDMTSGLDWDQGFEGGKDQTEREMYRASNWLQFVLDRPMAHPPGDVYNYSNGDPDVVSAIITRLTGRLAEDYAKVKLFAPLGIVDWHWEHDPQGLTRGDGMLYLLPRDMAKLGYLYLHHGEWEGTPLLPAGWADVLDHRLVNMHASYDREQSYSDFIWVFPHKRAYMMNGKNGQLIVVFPDLDMVAVTTARKQLRLEAFLDNMIAAVKSDTSALPPNPEAAERLAAAIRNAAIEKPTPVGPAPEIAAAISGKTYDFAANPLGLKSFTLDLNPAQPHFVFEYALNSPSGASVAQSVAIGLDGLYAKGEPRVSDPAVAHRPAAKGSWSDERTFVIDVPDVGYGEQQRLILSFDGKALRLRRTVAAGEGGFDASFNGQQRD